MPFIDVPIRICEGDTIVRNGDAEKVVNITDEDVQMAPTGGYTDRVVERDKMERHLAGAESIAIFRQGSH